MSAVVSSGKKVKLDDPIPYYLQLKDILHDLIERKVLNVGDKLASEAELCSEFNVSRTVVRQALQELEHEGLIVRRKGVGSFVAEPKVTQSFVHKLTSFYEDMTARNLETHADVLTNAVVQATPHIAKHLNLTPGTPVIVLERLRYVNDEPIQLVTSYFPHALCPGIVETDFSRRSLYSFLEEQGLVIAQGYRKLEAVRANEKEARLLRVKAGEPMLLIDSVGSLPDGTPLEYYHAVNRGDRVTIHLEVSDYLQTRVKSPASTQGTG